jgi:hypothetical protein
MFMARVKHVGVHPRKKNYAELLDDVVFVEEACFGGDSPIPADPREVLDFLAQYGIVHLQYLDERDGSPPMTNGVRKMIQLDVALGEFPRFESAKASQGVRVNQSPLARILSDHERTFEAVRAFTGLKDDGIVYLHGIGIVDQGFGYGRKLHEASLQAPNYLKQKALVRFVPAATQGSLFGMIRPIVEQTLVHDPSLCLSNGNTNKFYLVDVLEPPVYDDTTSFYVFVRPQPGHLDGFGTGSETLRLDHSPVNELFDRMKYLFQRGMFGLGYDPTTKTIEFRKLKGYGDIPQKKTEKPGEQEFVDPAFHRF